MEEIVYLKGKAKAELAPSETELNRLLSNLSGVTEALMATSAALADRLKGVLPNTYKLSVPAGSSGDEPCVSLTPIGRSMEGVYLRLTVIEEELGKLHGALGEIL